VAELAHRLRDTPFAPGDRTVVYNLKEMALNGTLCLNRQDMDGLFVAAIANPSVSPFVRAMLLSWHADYLWLHAHDMSAARGSLGQSLALNPGNPSNRLKWAQLLYISGERNAASKLLLALRGENLSGEERKTLEELLAAINITPQ
jgi:Tfp pilus assembly protein PilF